MTFKRYETDEVLVGAGDVFREDDGRQVGHARYRIIVQTAMLDDSATQDGGEARGLRHVSGNVGFAEAGRDGRMDLVGEALVLHLEDGRRLHFVLTNHHGDFSGGRLQ